MDTCLREVSLICIALLFAVYLLGYRCYAQRTTSGVRDYCLDEGFHASCDEGAVVVIKTAHYGRMNVGRCVTRNYGYIGCSTDVYDQVSKLCSGKRSCKIANFASTFSDIRPCPEDLKGYMEVSYECVSVAGGQPHVCESLGFLNVPSTSGYLASIVTEEGGYGSERCPWIIKALPGQRINVSVVDFSLATSNGETSGETAGGNGPITPRYCREYATLREQTTSRNIVVCNGDSRQKHTYLSDTNFLEIQVQRLSLTDSDSPPRFLLKYEVIGCPLPESPLNGHIRGSGNTIVVECNFTNEAWTLTCKDGFWQGGLGNCSRGGAATTEERVSAAGFLPLGITIVIIIGVALLICVSTLVVGLLHLKRRRGQELAASRREDALLYGTARPGEIKVDPSGSHRFATIDRTKTYSPIPANRVRSGGEYTHIWEVRRPPAVVAPATVDDPNHPNHLHHHHHHHKGCTAHPPAGTGGDQRTRPATCLGTLTKTGDCQGQDTLQRNDKCRASFTTFKPRNDEHIYQSPKFERKLNESRCRGTCPDPPFYFELDPKQDPAMVAHMTCSLPRTMCPTHDNHFHNSSC